MRVPGIDLHLSSIGVASIALCAFTLPQFGILPPKVVPVARTKKIVPRKEWKELKKQQQAGGKGFHTSAAASLSALQPPCYADSGESFGALSPAVLGASVDGGAPDASQRCPNTGVCFEWPLSFGWATGEAAGSVGGGINNSSSSSSSSRSAAASSTRSQSDFAADDGIEIAARLSQMSLRGRDRGEQQQRTRSMGTPDAAPLSMFSPLHVVLASHLALLGPAACSKIGVRTSTDGVKIAR